MADKAINELAEALEIFSNDWFVLEQNGEAKKLQGTTLKQYISEIQLNKIESVTFDTQKRCHIRLSDGTEIVSQSLGGPKGDAGPANNLTIGTVVSGIEASATITGEAPNQVLNLVLKQGEPGDPGEAAPTITNITIDNQYHLIVTLSDGQSYDAGYCRGASGAGTGDMLAGDYDPDGDVAAAGGIPEYVSAAIDTAISSAIGGEY